nr:unnamed protein product [Callosobruchus chinensis]
MAVVNPKKMIYSIVRGAFSKDGLYEFLRDLSFGKGNTAPVKQGKWPSFNTCTPWDGKDAEEPVIDDIDLSDTNIRILCVYRPKELPSYPRCQHATESYRCNTISMRDVQQFYLSFYMHRDKLSQDNFVLKYT